MRIALLAPEGCDTHEHYVGPQAEARVAKDKDKYSDSSKEVGARVC